MTARSTYPLRTYLIDGLALLALCLFFFWRDLAPSAGDRLSFAQGDFANQFVAFARYEASRLHAGQLPLWNPYAFAGHPLGLVVLFLAIGLGVAAVQLLPSLEFMRLSTRAAGSFEEMRGGFTPYDLIQLVLPAVGAPFPALYVGVLPLGLAAIAVVRHLGIDRPDTRPVREHLITLQVAFWSTLGGLALLVSFGKHLPAAPAGLGDACTGSADGDSVVWLERLPEHLALAVTNAAPTVLVLSELSYPGWDATVDGAAPLLLKADGMLRAVALDAGAHRVEMRFQPVSVYLGLAVSGVM